MLAGVMAEEYPDKTMSVDVAICSSPKISPRLFLLNTVTNFKYHTSLLIDCVQQVMGPDRLGDSGLTESARLGGCVRLCNLSLISVGH